MACADLDSCCSAIAYAWWMSSSISHSRAIVPLVNIPREDLALRHELTHLLRQVNVNPDHLCFATDMPDDGLQDSRWILVDHNCMMTTQFRRYEVVGIVDHHKDEGCALNADPRIIEPSGSCSSHVVKYWAPQIVPVQKEDQQCLRMVAASILIDTSNLSSKVTRTDEEAIQIVQQYLPTLTLGSFYEDIREAKTNVPASMSFKDMLRKDYKQWEVSGGNQLGISSIVKDNRWVQQNRPSWMEDVTAMMHDHKLNVFVFMATSTDGGEFHRELFLCVASAEFAWLKDALEQDSDSKRDLQLESYGAKLDGGCRWVWNQRNNASSRKVVGPLLRKLLSTPSSQQSSSPTAH